MPVGLGVGACGVVAHGGEHDVGQSPFQSPIASPWQVGSGRGVGSSAFYGVPVLGAVKIVPRVGGCILTAPALRRVGSDGGTGWYEDDRVRCRSGGGRSAKLPNVSEATPTRRLRPKVGCRKRGGEGSSRDGRSWRTELARNLCGMAPVHERSESRSKGRKWSLTR